MRSGKVVHAWAVEGEIDAATIRSNVFTLEWPPRSGRQREYPEADRAAWFPIAEARRRILAAQSPLIDALEGLVGERAQGTGARKTPAARRRSTM